MMKEIKEVYPVTIIDDRYGGCYSKGAFLAFNLESWEVPEKVWGGDIESADFWDDDSEEYVIGKGKTPDEAYRDLCEKMQPAVGDSDTEKYLFLDFDGVLNTSNFAKQMKRMGIDPFDEYGAMFDPNAIENLKHIVEHTGCKIVISSAWRNEPIKRMRELWKERHLPGEIYSMTPILLSTTYQNAMTGEISGYSERTAKALEINTWLENNASKKCRYVILDDENVFLPKQQKHLVQTNEREGLTDRIAQHAINILNC